MIPEACEIAYKGAPPEIQNKIKRVIQVWRERSIFEVVTQGTIEKRLDGTFDSCSFNADLAKHP